MHVSTPLPINSALKDLPIYQPGRPIEDVARELGLPAKDIIKLASNENPLGPSPAAWLRCSTRWRTSICIRMAMPFI
jgi:histidinol-phosphate/aromatic aminotransferase/cobyric acid decarboxylase-like protein